MPSSNPPPVFQNFRVYKALRVERTYLAVSTSAAPKGADTLVLRTEYTGEAALDLLAKELTDAYQAGNGKPVAVTLKVHGFNVRRRAFEREVIEDADPSRRYAPTTRKTPPNRFNPADETFRPGNRFLIGFRWPSEGLLSRGSLQDTGAALVRTPAIGLVLICLPLLAVLWLGGLQGFLDERLPAVGVLTTPLVKFVDAFRLALMESAPALAELLRLLLTPYFHTPVAAALLGAGLLFLVLRVSTYLRDRYRAVHYGVPDFGEFLRALEEKLYPQGVKVQLDVIGHSMGTLLLINAFRVMSDYFHGAGPGGPTDGALGRAGTFRLGTLMLCGADIPAAMATPDHNNYFLSALRRFQSTHVFSSDRDIILKWLSSMANWFSEPRHDLAGRKLGNVLIVRSHGVGVGRPDSRSGWTLWPVNRPVARNFHLYRTDPLVSPSHPATLHFHDCTLNPGLSGTHGYVATITIAAVLLLGPVALSLRHGITAWLLTVGLTAMVAGLIGRLLWPVLRDRGGIGGWVGFLADLPMPAIFSAVSLGWNPHSGYFAFQGEPRHRITALLRNPLAFPHQDSDGREVEEEDGRIRYRLVRISIS